MRWKYLHITCIALCVFGSLFELQARDTCAVIIEEQYQQGNFKDCLDIASNCYWTDSSQVLPIIGHAAYQAHQYADAKHFLLTGFEKGDSSILVLRLLSGIYEQEWNFPQAIKYSRLYLQKDSTNASEWYGLGTTALKANLYSDAFTAFAKALELNPQYYQARVKVADIMIRQDQALQAARLLEKGLQEDSNNVLLLLESGRSWYYADSFKRSVTNYKRAENRIDLTMKHSRIKGICHYRLEQYEQALSSLRSALVGTDKDYIHYYMGMAYLGLNDTASAANHFDLAIRESYSEHLPRYCDYRANLHEQAANWKAAIQLYKEAYRRSADPKYLIQIANAYDRWYEDKGVAISYFRRYIKSGDKQYGEFAKDRLQILKTYEHMK